MIKMLYEEIALMLILTILFILFLWLLDYYD